MFRKGRESVFYTLVGKSVLLQQNFIEK